MFSKLLMGLNVIIAITIVSLIPTYDVDGITHNYSIKDFKYKLVDAPLVPHVESYFGLLNKYCSNEKYNTTNRYVVELVDKFDLSIKNGTPSPTTGYVIGVCHVYPFKYNIQILRSWWEDPSNSESSKKQLIYHEMAHCLINRDHDPDRNHYMYPSINEIPEKIFVLQAIQDISNYCYSGD